MTRLTIVPGAYYSETVQYGPIFDDENEECIRLRAQKNNLLNCWKKTAERTSLEI